MPKPIEDFYPVPVELDGLAPGVPNLRNVGEGVSVIVLLRPGGGLSVLRDLCPHMGAPLSAGTYDAAKGTVSCPWHGYRFDCGTGKFVENPNIERFALLRGRYESFKPDCAPDYLAQSLGFEMEERKAYVRRPGRK